ncbi:N-acetyltransferase [Synergistales bacterium]|nr:N-acetyltransferase [Synergistales bacterium]
MPDPVSAFDIVPYEKKHIRRGFDCGVLALNSYLTQYASQDLRKNYAALFVAARNGSDKIVGYYTLSNASISLGYIPEASRNSLPKYNDVPAIRLGRLAVDKSMQRQGLGAELLADAVIRSVTNVAAWAVMTVEAKDEQARAFYLKFGFESLQHDKMRLYAMRQDLKWC